MLLAIDTATQMMSLALHDGQELLIEQTRPADQNHTTQLAPTVHELLQFAGVEMAALAALAVTTGPGSYTGVRIGLALAKGLATVHKLPLVGISTLDTIAIGQPYYARAGLVAVVQAGRRRIIAATYRWAKGRWVQRNEAQNMDWQTLFESVDGPAYLTGEISVEGQEALEQAQQNGVPISLAPAVYRLRRAGFLAEEAWGRLRNAKEDFAAAKVIPVYIKSQSVP